MGVHQSAGGDVVEMWSEADQGMAAALHSQRIPVEPNPRYTIRIDVKTDLNLNPHGQNLLYGFILPGVEKSADGFGQHRKLLKRRMEPMIIHPFHVGPRSTAVFLGPRSSPSRANRIDSLCLHLQASLEPHLVLPPVANSADPVVLAVNVEPVEVRSVQSNAIWSA
jgi:hypothetical protein